MSDIDKAILEIKDVRIGDLEVENYKYKEALRKIAELADSAINDQGLQKSIFYLPIILLMNTVKTIAKNALDE